MADTAIADFEHRRNISRMRMSLQGMRVAVAVRVRHALRVEIQPTVVKGHDYEQRNEERRHFPSDAVRQAWVAEHAVGKPCGRCNDRRGVQSFILLRNVEESRRCEAGFQADNGFGYRAGE